MRILIVSKNSNNNNDDFTTTMVISITMMTFFITTMMFYITKMMINIKKMTIEMKMMMRNENCSNLSVRLSQRRWKTRKENYQPGKFRKVLCWVCQWASQYKCDYKQWTCMIGQLPLGRVMESLQTRSEGFYSHLQRKWSMWLMNHAVEYQL